MLSLLSDEQRRERPYAIIGIIGSFVALASFLLLPIGLAGTGGPLSPTNGWKTLQILLTPPFGPGSIIGFLIVLLLPGGSIITLVIGGVGLFRPVPRRWVHLFTLALVSGLVLLGFSFGAYFAATQPLLGFWGMGAGYLGILVGRYASRRSAHRCTPARCHFSRLQASPSPRRGERAAYSSYSA